MGAGQAPGEVAFELCSSLVALGWEDAEETLVVILSVLCSTGHNNIE